MLCWTLRALEKAPSVEGIVVAVHPQDREAAQALVRSFRFRKVFRIVPGGSSRAESVFRGLKAIPSDSRWVVVHDAARPLVSPKLIEQTIRAARRFRAAIAAVPVVPTIKRGKDGWVAQTLDRNHLWVSQTPQAFGRKLLEKAHARGAARGLKATDDAALVEAMGHRVRIVPGESRNLKVTTPEDLVMAQALLKSRR
jgi:2-C-methyl-D-erythritol 4-phosphate cytidylyltransferase